MNRHFLQLAILLCYFAGYRLLLWSHFAIWPLRSVDLRGLFGDIFISCLLVFTAHLMPKRIQSHWYIATAVALIIAHLANYEVILATGGSIQFAHLQFALQGTMARGSIIRIGHISILCWSALILWLLIRVELKHRNSVSASPRFRSSAMAAILIVPLGWNVLNKNFSPATAHWRQFNFIVGNIHDFALTITPSAKRKQIAGEMGTLLKHSSMPSIPDLQGTPIAKLNKDQRPNIILIMGEGIAGARFPQNRNEEKKYHEMTSMQFLADRGLYIPNYIGLNRVTNNGQFSILCGMTPNLNVLSPKMDMYDPARDGKCMPQTFKENGYRTVYLQGAWLEFMNKMRFMSLAGFSQIMGANVFDSSEMGSPWGADDDVLFRKSLSIIESLNESSEAPWFLAILTVGTHHPFSGGRNHKSRFPQESLEHSMSFLDEQLLQFFKQLENQGTLRDTLVILTSDESSGVGDIERDTVYQNWLPLIVAGPGIAPKIKNDGLFSTADIAISLTDYVFASDIAQNSFDGRSVFRSYDNERNIVFGNDFYRHVGVFNGTSSSITCDHYLKICTKNVWNEPSFRTWEQARFTNHEELNHIQDILDRSQWYPK